MSEITPNCKICGGPHNLEQHGSEYAESDTNDVGVGEDSETKRRAVELSETYNRLEKLEEAGSIGKDPEYEKERTVKEMLKALERMIDEVKSVIDLEADRTSETDQFRDGKLEKSELEKGAIIKTHAYALVHNIETAAALFVEFNTKATHKIGDLELEQLMPFTEPERQTAAIRILEAENIAWSGFKTLVARQKDELFDEFSKDRRRFLEFLQKFGLDDMDYDASFFGKPRHPQSVEHLMGREAHELSEHRFEKILESDPLLLPVKSWWYLRNHLWHIRDEQVNIVRDIGDWMSAKAAIDMIMKCKRALRGLIRQELPTMDQLHTICLTTDIV